MELVKLRNLNDYDFALSDISAIDLIPRCKVLSHVPQGRLLNGFLYLLEGECSFSFVDRSINMKPESFIYLPKGSKHTYMSKTENIRYLRIDFKITDLETNNEIIFSDEPMLLFSNIPDYYNQKSQELVNTFMSGSYGNKLKCMALLCDFLYNLSFYNYNKKMDHPEYKKIFAAIDYIEKHYTEEIQTETLSDLCFLSPTHFRRLFKQLTDVTPTEYKTKIRIDKACQLLKNRSCNISEISDRLGFESIYYFSRVFKKETGVSPKSYNVEY